MNHLELAERKILHLRTSTANLEVLELLDILDEIVAELKEQREQLEDHSQSILHFWTYAEGVR